MEIVERFGQRATVRRAVLIVVGLAIAAATASAGTQAAPTQPSGTSPCTRAQTRTAVSTFVTDFNRGSFANLDSLFAQEPAFQWFSTPRPGRRLGRAARQRDTLIHYFRQRHARHEEFRLVAFHFTGNAPRWSNFWFEASRSADDFDGGNRGGVTGKGAAICEQGSPQLIVVSLGGPAPLADRVPKRI